MIIGLSTGITTGKYLFSLLYIQFRHFFVDVPPAFDHYLQHEEMVKEGLCKVAEKNKYKNRYCNLFPFDRNLVQLKES